MEMFDDLEHTSRSLTACMYYEISVSIWRIIKKNNNLMMEKLPELVAKYIIWFTIIVC